MLRQASGIPSEVTIDDEAYRYLLTSGNIRVVVKANFEARYTREETLAILTASLPW